MFCSKTKTFGWNMVIPKRYSSIVYIYYLTMDAFPTLIIWKPLLGTWKNISSLFPPYSNSFDIGWNLSCDFFVYSKNSIYFFNSSIISNFRPFFKKWLSLVLATLIQQIQGCLHAVHSHVDRLLTSCFILITCHIAI